MNSIEMIAERREKTGSVLSRRLRREGRLPVNLYGEGGETVALHLDAKEFSDAIRHHARIVILKGGGADESAVIRDVVHDPISQDILHADLIRVDLTKKTEVKVPLRLRGPAAGVKTGGVVMEHHDEVMVRCMPLEIPTEIEADIRPLEVHQALHARDLELPEGVELVDAPDLVLVNVTEPRFAVEEEAVGEGEGEGVTEGAEPEVIGKPKAEDDDKGGSEG